MLHIDRVVAQAAISAERALVIARERFPNLYANGILGRRCTGRAIDPAHVQIALAVLARCRKSKVPAVHSFDLRQAIGNVSLGAVIVACIALEFDCHSWFGTRSFGTHVLVNVNRADVAKIAGD
jgi:hypothetical protein